MPRPKLHYVHMSLRLKPDVARRLDAWCANQFLQPARNAAINAILNDWLNQCPAEPSQVTEKNSPSTCEPPRSSEKK